MDTIDLSKLTPAEREQMLNKLLEEKKKEEGLKREAYEGLRTEFLIRIQHELEKYVTYSNQFKQWLRGEAEAWYEILKEYGKLKRDDQIGFTLSSDDFKFYVKGNRVKGFDERADIAEKRLVDFLSRYVANSDKGTKDPMYKLALSMISRNEQGDLDYKSISRLYELESDFNDPEYSEIMQLFKESNVVENTVINFYFEEKNQYNVWRKVEPSFNNI